MKLELYVAWIRVIESHLLVIAWLSCINCGSCVLVCAGKVFQCRICKESVHAQICSCHRSNVNESGICIKHPVGLLCKRDGMYEG